MAGARHFTDLDCWKLSTELKLRTYEFVQRRASRHDRQFVEQCRDAAASAPRNIAEGFGRHTNKDFAHFLDIARGSLNECQHHLQDAVERGYLNQEECQELLVLSRRACGAVAGLQRHLRRKRDHGAR